MAWLRPLDPDDEGRRRFRLLSPVDGSELRELSCANEADVAAAMERARRAHIETRVLSHRDFASRDAYDAALAALIEDLGAGLVVLAGFMRILSPDAVMRFPLRIVNVHPALLPAFPGAHAADQAIEHAVKLTGVTVHFVDEHVYHGPIISQEAVPVLPDDRGFLVVARNANGEGSYGERSDGTPRDPAAGSDVCP